MAMASVVDCACEYQVADAQSGRNIQTKLCASAVLVKRRTGIEIVAQAQAFRSAIKLQEHAYEVYFRCVAQGKIAFIRRDNARIQQFNIRDADPSELQELVQFCIKLGATPKSPLGVLSSVSASSKPSHGISRHARVPFSPEPAATRKRAMLDRRPLSDRSNMSAESPQRDDAYSPNPKRTHKRRRLEQAESLQVTMDQQRVLDLIAARQNVFFTGSAGTGKSFLLQQILKPRGLLESYLRGKHVFATATTGIAAYNIGGMTLHHFAGIDARATTCSAGQLARLIESKRDALARWKSVDVLVVDEVSMLDGALFDTLEELARALRPKKAGAFFGGIQLVLSGDFFQLPPVATREQQTATKLCFESAAWRSGVTATVELTKKFRQTNSEFVEILDAFRIGKPTQWMVNRLNAQCSASHENDAEAIRIFTHNKDVLETNSKRLSALQGKKFNFIAADTGKREYLAGCPAPATFVLKQNAHVMLIKTINANAGLVNGCRGVVTGFTPQSHLPVVRFENGTSEIVRHEEFPVRVADAVLASRRQLPLTLAWAISIHKSQGLAFSTAVLDLSRVFEFGQAYVALSRVRSLEGLHLRSRLDLRSLRLADPRVLDFYQSA